MNVQLRGMGSLGDAAYDAIYDAFKAQAIDPVQGRAMLPAWWNPPNPETCLKIQCGAMTQAEAGDELRNCTFGGFQGVRSCADPLCAPYCGHTAAAVARATAQPLPVATRIAATFKAGPARGCDPVYSGAYFSGPYSSAPPCGCGGAGFVNDHPVIAVLLVAGAAYGVYRWRESRNRG
jgi:hypothetical protein